MLRLQECAVKPEMYNANAHSNSRLHERFALWARSTPLIPQLVLNWEKNYSSNFFWGRDIVVSEIYKEQCQKDQRLWDVGHAERFLLWNGAWKTPFRTMKTKQREEIFHVPACILFILQTMCISLERKSLSQVWNTSIKGFMSGSLKASK